MIALSASLLIAQVWTGLPADSIYPTTMSRLREARMGGVFFGDLESRHWYWDVGLAGRIGLVRHDFEDGTSFQIDAEGGVFARLDLERNRDVLSADFLGGLIFSYALPEAQFKLEYRHVSSHLVDEYFGQFPGAKSNRYSRDAIVAGATMPFAEVFRSFLEIGFGAIVRGAAKPWNVAAGIEFSPLEPTTQPFAALEFELSEEGGWRPFLSVSTGVQWRLDRGDRRVRIGLYGNTGPSPQLQFIDRRETSLGLGGWFDF